MTRTRMLIFMWIVMALLVIAPSTVIAAEDKGDGLYTIEEIYSKKKELKGQTIKVRGKVVKSTPNIMGRTWVHVKDGTGSGATSKLIFRSKTENPALNSIVTATGRLDVDVDFGSGYFYPVIVEDATFKK